MATSSPSEARTLLVADAHLRPGNPPSVPGQNNRLARFLREATPGVERVVLLGDIFHLWFERAGRVAGDYAEALGLFADAASGRLTGTPVVFEHVCGNRDFAVGPALPDDSAHPRDGDLPAPRWPGFFQGRDAAFPSALARAGIRPHGPSFDFEQAGQRVRCVHGDAYCLRQWMFRVARWGISGWPGRTVDWWGPWSALAAFYGIMQRRPRRFFKALPPDKEQKNTLRIAQTPLEDAVREGVDLIVCGHLHQAFSRDVPLPDGRRGRLEALPAFQDGGYGELVGTEFHIRHFGD